MKEIRYYINTLAIIVLLLPYNITRIWSCIMGLLKKIIISINECDFLVKYKFELFALLGLATLMALFWLASIIV